MALVLVGLSHKTAPVEARERLAARAAASLYTELRGAGWGGSVVLSTCNRFEILISDGRLPAPEVRRWLCGFLDSLAGMPLAPYLYAYEEAAAVEHLFRVAAGLDSLVIGEAEILGQVKAAYEAARAAATADKTVNVLFQRALHVGKAVRSQTLLAAGQTSVASVSVALAERIFGDLAASRVLILGAGQMAELSARHLLGAKVSRLYIANRTASKAAELAEQVRGEAVAWERFPEFLTDVDVVIGSTGSDRPVVTRAMAERAMEARRGRSLFFIDIAMPRDVENGVHELPNAYVYTLDDLRAIVEENLVRRRGEIDRAASMVGQKAAEFRGWLEAADKGVAAPLRHKPTTAPSPVPQTAS